MANGLGAARSASAAASRDANAASTRALEASFAASKSNGACLALGACLARGFFACTALARPPKSKGAFFLATGAAGGAATFGDGACLLGLHERERAAFLAGGAALSVGAAAGFAFVRSLASCARSLASFARSPASWTRSPALNANSFAPSSALKKKLSVSTLT